MTKPRIHFVHGFNVKDNGAGTTGLIGGFLSSTANNFNGYITAVILAADDSPMSATDRSRIERFIGLLDSGIDIPLA